MALRKKPKKTNSTIFKRLPQNITKQKLFIFILAFALIGTIAIILTHAATATVSVEPENGNVVSSAVEVSSGSSAASASNGSYVQFKAPTSGGGGSCAAPTCFPDDSNTGVPAGTNLTTYTGSTTISSCGVVIDSKIINGGIDITAGNGFHDSAHPCVTIKNSLIKGQVDAGYADQNHGPLLITDTEIAIPIPNAGNFSALQEANIYAWRINVHGGRHNIQCDGYCEIHDSYAHDNWYVGAQHMNAFITNGNSGRALVLDHSTFRCKIIAGSTGSGGGCSADISFFGDFGPVSNTTITNNLFLASTDVSYCTYTGANQPAKDFPTGTNLVWKNNVWERGSNNKCDSSGPVYPDWAFNSGNLWCNNKWEDGGNVLSSADKCTL